MYETIPPDFVTVPVALFTMLLLCFGISLVVTGPKMKRRDLTFIGVSMLVVLVAGWIFGSAPVSGIENNRRYIMEKNIITKYHEQYHLKDVEFSGSGGKGDSGKYFTLTYEDMTTEKRKFYFSESGEPSMAARYSSPY